MSESQLLIPVDMDKEEVGNLFENYNLNSAAVVDKNNKLVGMIMSGTIIIRPMVSIFGIFILFVKIIIYFLCNIVFYSLNRFYLIEAS